MIQQAETQFHVIGEFPHYLSDKWKQAISCEVIQGAGRIVAATIALGSEETAECRLNELCSGLTASGLVFEHMGNAKVNYVPCVAIFKNVADPSAFVSAINNFAKIKRSDSFAMSITYMGISGK